MRIFYTGQVSNQGRNNGLSTKPSTLTLGKRDRSIVSLLKLKKRDSFLTALFIFCSLLFSMNVTAQSVQTLPLPSNNNQVSYAVPGGFYGPMAATAVANQFSRYAYVYPQSLIGTSNADATGTIASGDVITNLEFDRGFTNTVTMGGTTNFKIYLINLSAATTNWGATTLNWTTQTGLSTLVYNASPSALVNGAASKPGNVSFPITSFTYTGGSLGVLVEYTQTTAQTAEISWGYENNTTIGAYVNNSALGVIGTGVATNTLGAVNAQSLRHPTLKIDYLLPCTTPAVATTLNLTPTSSTITGTFNAPGTAPTGYLVIRTTTSTAPTTPVLGTTYTAGSSALGGTIVSTNTTTGFTDNGLSAVTPYWYWIYSYNTGCAGTNPVYSSTSLNGTATTPGITKNWVGLGAGGASNDFNLGSNWSPPGVPSSTDNLIINWSVNANNTISLTANSTVGSLTISDNTNAAGVRTHTLDINTKTLVINNNFSITNNAGATAVDNTPVLIGAGGALTVNGNLALSVANVSSVSSTVTVQNSGTMTVNGTTVLNSLNTGTASTAQLMVGNSPAITTFNGNVTLDNGTTVTGNSALLAGTAASTTGSFVFNADLIIGANGGTSTNVAGNYLFDKNGTQNFTTNNTAFSFDFTNLQIGNTFNPTVVRGGAQNSTKVSGNLTVNGSSILDLGTLNLNRSAAGGTLTLASTSTLRLAGTTGGQTGSNFPSLFGSFSLATGSTVEYYGGTQTVYNVAPTYGNLTITTAGTKTAGGALVVSGTMKINTGATFAASSFTHTVGGNWTNNGTFTAGTSTITFNTAAAQIIAGTASTGFNNLIVNKTASANTVTSQTPAFTVAGNLTVTQGNLILTATDANYTLTGNLSVAVNGTLTHNVDWDVAGKQLTVGGNIDINGAYSHAGVPRSHVQMTGTTKTLNTGTSSLSIVTLAGATVTASGPVTITDNFWAPFGTSGSFSTGGQTVIASGALLISAGTVNVNGGSLTVSGGVLLGSGTSSGALNVSAGTFVTDGITLGDPASTTASTITQSGGTFTVNGAVTINQPTAAFSNAWNINAQTATVSGLITFAGTNITTTRIGAIVLTTGTLNANGGISFAGTVAATKVINLGTTGTLNLKGNLSGANVATLTAGISGSNFNYNDATSAQTVSIFGAGAYNNLLINTTGGVGATLGAAITTTNVTGDLRVQSGTLNTSTFAIAGNAAKTLQVVNGAFLNVGGATTAFPTGFGTVSLGATSTVNYNGTGAQTVSAQNYGNLTVTATSSRTVTLAGAGTIGIANVFTPATTLTTYTNTGSTVSFNGASGSQNIPAFTFNILNINNTSGVVLTGNATVNGGASALSFSNGKITTGSNAVILSATTTSTTAGAGKYIFGKQTYNIPAGTPSGTFYVGDATNYTPATIALTSTMTAGGTLTVNTTAGDESNIGTSSFIINKTVNRFWTVAGSGLTPATPTYNATFTFINPGDLDAGTNTANVVIQRYNGTWNATTIGAKTSTSTQATGITGFGNFQIGEACTPPVINTPAVTNISCNGSSDGAIDITTVGGTTPFTYAWTGPGGFTAATEDITALAAGNYSLLITATGGCTASVGPIAVTQPAVLNASVGSTNIDCNGASTGTITITSPTGGYGTYEYSINGGGNWQSSGSFTGLPASTYDVRIRDAAHTTCVVTLNGALSITQLAAINANLGSTDVTCFGANDGTITLSSVTGGSGTYQYTINGGTNWVASGSFTGLAGGSYNVQIRDAAHPSCVVIFDLAHIISAPAVLSASVASTNVTCNGSSDGTITITSPNGGYGTYEYTINGGTNWQAGGSFTGLAASTYNVQIRDAAHTGCIITLNGALVITAPAVLNASVASSDISCNGSTDGGITITSPTGGYGNYEYSIDAGTNWQSPGSFTALAAGTYNVQIRDADHITCVITLNGALVISEPAVISATLNSTDVTCFAANDGTITLTSVTGGSGTYEYTINGGTNWQASGSFTGLAAGTYNVQIRDAAHTSCVVIFDLAHIINAPAVLSASVASTDISCNGSTDGTISITSEAGGYGTYEFTINGGTNWQSSGSFAGLAAGTYNVQIRDAAHTGCVVTLNAALVITEPAVLNASVASSNVDCNGANNGSITITSPTGGFGNFEFTINGGTSWQSSGSFTGLAAGTYNVQVRDADHITCVVTLNAALVITEPAVLSATLNSTDASCGINDGSITLTSPTGGSGSYEYSIDGGANWLSSGSFTGLAAGSYNVQVRDAAHTSCVVILDNSHIINQASTPDVPTSGGDQTVCSDGRPTQTITATATSSNTITWYTAATGGTIVSPPVQVGPGTVTYYAEASNGTCVSATRAAVTLTIQAAPLAPVSGGDETVCSNGNPTQTLIATATSPNTITWYDAATAGTAVTPALIGVGTATFYAEASNGTCVSSTRTAVTLTIRPVLATPGSISGPLDVCPLVGSATPSVYSIAPVSGATFYTWTVPPGATIVSGQGTTDLGVTFDNSYAFTNQYFRVDAESPTACASGLSSLEVLKVLPGIPTVINGPSDACPYIGQPTTATYSIAAVPGATSYTWTVSNNMTIVSGQGSLSVEVSFLAGFTSGSVKVQANSNCGARSPRSLTVIKVSPAVPGAISGPVDACSYIGTATQVNYSIADVGNATSYNWTVPAHVTLVSGQGTTSIMVTFNAGYTAALIRVRSVSTCSTSGYQSLSVGAAVTTIPGVITGPTNACQFIGTGLEGTYTINKVPGASSYIWSVPTGASITAHPAGTGVNDTIVHIAYTGSFVSGTDISVQAVSCLVSAARTLTITRVLIAQPGLISTVSINVCPYMVSAANPTGTPVVYTIRKMAATSYNWTAPAGSSITNHPNGTGVNDTTIEITYSSGFTSGDVTVSAVNNCGPGAVRTLGIISLRPGTVGGITTAQTASCPTRQYTYSVASLPTNATSILWAVPTGGTILSGQGTLSITVSYTSGAINGTVTATGVNNCGTSSSIRTISIKLTACTGRPAGKATIPEVTVPYAAEPMQLNVFPNPTVSDFKLQVITADKEVIHVRILDMQGRELKEVTVMPCQAINIGADLKAGSYLVEVVQGKNRTTQKMVKF